MHGESCRPTHVYVLLQSCHLCGHSDINCCQISYEWNNSYVQLSRCRWGVGTCLLMFSTQHFLIEMASCHSLAHSTRDVKAMCKCTMSTSLIRSRTRDPFATQTGRPISIEGRGGMGKGTEGKLTEEGCLQLVTADKRIKAISGMLNVLWQQHWRHLVNYSLLHSVTDYLTDREYWISSLKLLIWLSLRPLFRLTCNKNCLSSFKYLLKLADIFYTFSRTLELLHCEVRLGL